MMETRRESEVAAGSAYLELLKRVLTRTGFENSYSYADPLLTSGRNRVLLEIARRLLEPRGFAVVRSRIGADRSEGKDWPTDAETMVGMARLDNLQHCAEQVLADDVPGDFIEAGAWRGGASIFMRGVLRARSVTDRTVWVADSFKGLPRPDMAHPADSSDQHWRYRELRVSLDEVKANFLRYGLLDDQVKFLVGWFRDTLSVAPIEALSVVRLDGDMYGSTIEALEVLYPKLSSGGFLIIDDYALPACRQAVGDYRQRVGITEPVQHVDWTGAYWRKRS